MVLFCNRLPLPMMETTPLRVIFINVYYGKIFVSHVGLISSVGTSSKSCYKKNLAHPAKLVQLQHNSKCNIAKRKLHCTQCEPIDIKEGFSGSSLHCNVHPIDQYFKNKSQQICT